MTLKERLVTIIAEHVKASPFRHYQMIFFTILFCLVLGITELLALIGQGYILQQTDIAAPNYNVLYVGSQIAVNWIPILMIVLIAYIIFVQITYVIMLAAMIIGIGAFVFLAPRIWEYISNRWQHHESRRSD